MCTLYQRLCVHRRTARFFHELVRGRHGSSHRRAQWPCTQQRLRIAAERFEFEPGMNHAAHVPHLHWCRFGVFVYSRQYVEYDKERCTY
jgi:hypothetical protein